MRTTKFIKKSFIKDSIAAAIAFGCCGPHNVRGSAGSRGRHKRDRGLFIRRSTLDAIEIKRSNVGVMEAISARILAAFQMATLLSPSPGFLE